MKKTELIRELAAVIKDEGLGENDYLIEDLLAEASKYDTMGMEEGTQDYVCRESDIKTREPTVEESEYFEAIRQANISPI